MKLIAIILPAFIFGSATAQSKVDFKADQIELNGSTVEKINNLIDTTAKFNNTKVDVVSHTGLKKNYLPSLVSINDFEKLIKKVKKHRKSRLVTLDEFNLMSTQPKVVILDTRSDSMYNAKHIKGAIHLNFSDFTQENLKRLIPDFNTKILIYCNNNFDEALSEIEVQPIPKKSTTNNTITKVNIDSTISTSWSPPKEAIPVRAFATKSVVPSVAPKGTLPVTLALNIPTYINLYGYGYRNVYELSELVSVNDPRIQLEGTAVNK